MEHRTEHMLYILLLEDRSATLTKQKSEMKRVMIIALGLFATCGFAFAQQKTFAEAQEKPHRKYFSLYSEIGIGYQIVGRRANLTVPKASNKYQAGLSLEFDSDPLRHKEVKKITFLYSYSFGLSWDKVSFNSYYDYSGSTSFNHEITLLRFIPTSEVTIRFNQIHCKPYFSLGSTSRELLLRNSISVRQGGVLYFANGNFQPATTRVILLNVLINAVPCLGTLTLLSYPALSVGFTLGKRSRLSLAVSLTSFDNINLTSRPWNYPVYLTDIDFGARLSRTTFLLTTKFKIL